jgi:hypothetical protein
MTKDQNEERDPIETKDDYIDDVDRLIRLVATTGTIICTRVRFR